MTSPTRSSRTTPRRSSVVLDYVWHLILRTKLKKLGVRNLAKNASSLAPSMIWMIIPHDYLPLKLLTVPSLMMIMMMLPLIKREPALLQMGEPLTKKIGERTVPLIGEQPWSSQTMTSRTGFSDPDATTHQQDRSFGIIELPRHILLVLPWRRDSVMDCGILVLCQGFVRLIATGSTKCVKCP